MQDDGTRLRQVAMTGGPATNHHVWCRAINGILAMREFKDQFGTNCFDKKGELDICTDDSALIVAILSAGTVVGALLAAPAADSIGRRRTLLISVGVFCIGAICQVCAYSLPLMLVGR